jgi:hypothetical protein
MARYRSIVTFERDGADPVVSRGEIVESCPSSAARKAVFRALPEVGRSKYDSIVIVLDRVGS